MALGDLLTKTQCKSILSSLEDAYDVTLEVWDGVLTVAEILEDYVLDEIQARIEELKDRGDNSYYDLQPFADDLSDVVSEAYDVLHAVKRLEDNVLRILKGVRTSCRR